MARKNFWEVVRIRHNRPNRNFGSHFGETEDNALIRFLHLKGVQAMIGIHGQLVYGNPRNEEIWGKRGDWEIRLFEGKPNQYSRQADRDKESLEHARARAMETWL